MSLKKLYYIEGSISSMCISYVAAAKFQALVTSGKKDLLWLTVLGCSVPCGITNVAGIEGSESHSVGFQEAGSTRCWHSA